jgi:hypothetical protein
MTNDLKQRAQIVLIIVIAVAVVRKMTFTAESKRNTQYVLSECFVKRRSRHIADFFPRKFEQKRRKGTMQSQAKRQALVWGGLLIVLGVLSLVATVTDLSAWMWVIVLALAGLGAFGVYLTDRSDLTPLIPAYVLWAVALLVALITLNILSGEFIATYVLATIALPFLVVFARDQEQWWALIPAYVLLAVGLMIGLTAIGVLTELLIPAYVMFAIAIPFLVVFALNPKEWWPLIPGGIMAVIGLAFLVAEAAVEYIAPIVLVIAGLWILARQFIHKR